ncbi:VWA domain-containing protein [Rubritalea tangerina]|uniref:VWA domain-containing protein n=1 Tax=Rubritalea tangerina TaxID=430798 RepID=A0ABW4ZAW3_9BACT
MNLLNPAYLWSLLAILPLVAVYFMKTKPRKRVTNALFLWQKVLEEKSSHFWFKKMRNLWSLLLMAIAFTLAAFSLTNPQLGDKKESQDLLIILDSSVSMRGTNEGSNRFDAARDTITSWLKSVEGGSRVALATADSQLHYHCNLTNNPNALLEALHTLEASSLPFDPRALHELSLLEHSEASPAHCRVLFVTDNAAHAEQLPSQVELITLTQSTPPNVGITAADIAPLNDQRAKLFFTLQSTHPEDTDVELELSHKASGRIAKLITVTIPANNSLSEVVEIDDAEPGLWQLDVSHQDSFLEDNQAILGLNHSKAIGISLDSQNNYFYARCIQAFSDAENLLEVLDNGSAQVHVGQGSLHQQAPSSLVFAPSADSPHWDITGEMLEHVVVDELVKDHPLTKHLNLDNMHFAGAVKMDAPDNAVVILRELNGTPLLYEHQHEDKKVVVANFQPSLDNFYLSPWFPIMVHNAARYLAGREQELPSVVKNGASVTVPTNSSHIQQTFHGSHSTDVVSNNVPATHALNKLGGYSYTTSNQDWHTGSAVLSASESGIQPQASTTPEQSQPSSGWPIAWWLVLAAALFAITEEALYHRRKVG